MHIPDKNRIALSPAIMAIALLGDKRCEIPIGATVEKIKEDGGGDLHPIGSRGKVLGNLHNPHYIPHDAYYIHWELTGIKSFSAGNKVKEIKHAI